MSLGALINQARESAGLSIEDLSAATNIRNSLLREMESDSFVNCGGETYARGHIRNIATKLGVDPLIFIQAFEDEQMQSDRSMRDLLLENSVIKEPQEVRKVSWKVLAAISASSLLIVAIAQIVITNTSSTDIAEPMPTVTAIESPEPATTVIATAAPEATPTDEPTVSTGTGVEVIVSAVRAKSWLFVTDSAGQTLFSGQIARGTIKTFSAELSLNFRIGNAGGVDLTVNGNAIESIGEDGEVVSVSYGVDS